MSRYLCISVTFLDPFFHGKGDGGKPEWPPSPLRLFQALLAGSRTGCRNREWATAKTEAFCWLEDRDPPLIVSPEARPAAAYTLFVPNNDSDKSLDRQTRLTSKVVRPHCLTNGHTLHYLWRIAHGEWAEARPHAELLCSEARNLVALGWGIDQAIGNGRVLDEREMAALDGVRWEPWTGHRSLQASHRVPEHGTLAGLEAVHQSFVRSVQGTGYRPPAKLQAFGTVTYMAEVALPPRPYAVFELPEGAAFRHVVASEVAAMLRSCTCRAAQQDTHDFPGGSEQYVAGHVNGKRVTPARFSYLPLPTIGHAHADGMIRRLLIAEPYDGDGTHARWAQQRLRTRPLTNEDGRDRGLLLDPWRQSSRKMIHRYTQPSREWTTVTPVILPGYDDHKQTKAERLFLKAAAQAGVSTAAISDMTLRKAPSGPAPSIRDAIIAPTT